MKVTRTFRHYAIEWDRGSTWSYYTTAAQAQAQIDMSHDTGKVVAHDFTITFDRLALLELNDKQIDFGAIELVDEQIG